jgi:hypothetical protein
MHTYAHLHTYKCILKHSHNRTHAHIHTHMHRRRCVAHTHAHTHTRTHAGGCAQYAKGSINYDFCDADGASLHCPVSCKRPCLLTSGSAGVTNEASSSATVASTSVLLFGVDRKGCDPISAPRGATVVLSHGLVHGGMATFSCAPGFLLLGVSSLQCMDGEWSYAPPSCKVTSFACSSCLSRLIILQPPSYFYCYCPSSLHSSTPLFRAHTRSLSLLSPLLSPPPPSPP